MSGLLSKKIEAVYEAFGRGDVPWILEQLSESVEWEYGTRSTGVPWLEPRRGRQAVAGFFSAIAEHLEITRFEPKAILEGDHVVVVLLDVDANIKSGSGTFSEVDEVHIWRFDNAGKISKFRHRVDTKLQIDALTR